MTTPAASTLNGPQVIAAFQRLTGTRFRFVTHDMEAQAIDFGKKGFTIEDLELVIRWVKRQIARGEGGLTAQSLTWRVMFGRHGAGDEWQVFQDRLGLAEVAFRPPPPARREVPATRTIDAAGNKVTVLAEESAPEPQPARGVVADALRGLAKTIGGQS